MPSRQAMGSVPLSRGDREQIQALYQKLVRSSAQLVGPDGRSHRLPGSLSVFLQDLIADLLAGQSVAIVQKNAQLTTVEAARMLGCSRQFLVNLLERGEIPFHLVGTHRRVYVRDVLDYKARRDQKRRALISGLTKAEKAEGLYDKPAADGQPN